MDQGGGERVVGMTGGAAPPWCLVSTPTFEAITTQALELVFASGHACGTILARLALTRGAVIALPDASAA